jgi:hypothetical protein
MRSNPGQVRSGLAETSFFFMSEHQTHRHVGDPFFTEFGVTVFAIQCKSNVNML